MSEGSGTQLPPSRNRLIGIVLDQNSIARSNANIEHEREVAIFDLLDANSFALPDRDAGPYRLLLSIVEDRLAFTVNSEADQTIITHLLSLTPFRRVVKDYFIVCDTYYQAIRSAPPSRIQSIDMGRRSLHNEGSRLLQERLQGKLAIDHDTARRMFTLICALHWKG